MALQREFPSTGRTYEGIAFSFCKAATVALICGRYALPIAALFAAGFFVAAYAKGERETRCFLGPPLVVAGFWVAVVALWTWNALDPGVLLRWLPIVPGRA